MSGTSADGIDLALVNFSNNKPELVASFYQAYDQQTHLQITTLYQQGENEIDRCFHLDIALAHQFSRAIKLFLTQQNLQPTDITAIGNHGQTVRHRPSSVDKKVQNPFTLQIGCNQTLAALTSIRVIGDFRRKDMALGGQGAPLVPAFHQAIIPSTNNDIFIVNIGGIANITYLPTSKEKTILGFDTGPGNALMDDWYQQHHQARFDKDGAWAAQGMLNKALLADFLSDNYFKRPPPKSTGREVLHLNWLLDKTKNHHVSPIDIQATLAHLTAITIADQIKLLSSNGNVYLCGGGVLNKNLVQLLTNELKVFSLSSTSSLGIDSDALEAMAFAWFAYAYDHKITGNIPDVTGASRATVLGVNFSY